MAEGRVVQVAGRAVDVEFPPEAVPGLYDAIEIYREDGCKVVGEVQEHLGNGLVRALALDLTDGLRPGARAVDTGGPAALPGRY